MPPQPKITKSMVADAAFAIARTEGWQQINARSVSQRLGCSTQPVMYHFSTMEELRRAVYQKADEFHSTYLMKDCERNPSPMLEIGLRYIRFAANEPHLFQFLFQSNAFSGKSLIDLVNAAELKPLLEVLQQTAGGGGEEARQIFFHLFLTVHGYASLLANHAMAYEEANAAKLLKQTFTGAVYALKEKKDEYIVP
ncbi:MAG: TetR/AcrR family transcriptional regulator [Oscillospiraceae bacterium]|nr:TetR/AcrR family transcriptional regulator [Oscillospiraceae bacterium]